MGLLDEMMGKASSLFSSGEEGETGVMGGIGALLGGRESGGFGGLVQSFQEKGLGDIISSWIGTGENSPISAEQIQQVVGSDMIQNLAAKAGIQPEELSAKLAEYLPGVIDRLTPDGVIPEGGLLEKGLGFFTSRLS